MDVSASFEMIRGQGNTFLFADTVRLPEAAPKRTTPLHFHPQIELVWFRAVTGSVVLDGARYPLQDRQAVLLPSMQVHAFETGGGSRDWTLLQFEPFLIEPLLQQAPLLATAHPLILSPDPETSARIDFLCDWLCAMSTQPDRALEAQQVLQLILVTLASTRTEVSNSIPQIQPLAGPLQDALRQIHVDPRAAPPLSAAARSARVTDAHFSRLFKARIGMGYAAYVQMHRLNVAARHLLTDTAPVSQIAYRVGFSSAAHFSTAFAERFGLNPRTFRLRAAGLPAPPQKDESD